MSSVRVLRRKAARFDVNVAFAITDDVLDRGSEFRGWESPSSFW